MQNASLLKVQIDKVKTLKLSPIINQGGKSSHLLVFYCAAWYCSIVMRFGFYQHLITLNTKSQIKQLKIENIEGKSESCEAPVVRVDE